VPQGNLAAASVSIVTAGLNQAGGMGFLRSVQEQRQRGRSDALPPPQGGQADGPRSAAFRERTVIGSEPGTNDSPESGYLARRQARFQGGERVLARDLLASLIREMSGSIDEGRGRFVNLFV